ncbi:MAG: hypothetical protein KDK54_21405 [Leptospiraceae bacterium]|nr:hypothetical protein [Leptospiraceae bacterium]
MNEIICLETEYIRSDLTIEVLLIQDKISLKTRVVYIYNYQGIHFRVFDSLLGLSQFFRSGEDASLIDFDTDEELDEYLNGMVV